jgi:hypothetical protein
MVWNCATICKTPTILTHGPCPLSDTVGMSIAVDMLFNMMTATPRLWGESHIQFESMQQVCATFTKTWISFPKGIAEGASFSSGFGKTIWTSCPTEQDWFARFLRDCKIRMGYATKSNCSLTNNTINKLLSLLQQEAEVEVPHMAREYWKVGAAIALAVCASLQGPEMLLLDLASLRNHIQKGKECVLPDKPLQTGTNLTGMPHVVVVLIGKFKGESGVHHHMLSLASTNMSGIALRWWLEKLIQVWQEEGCVHGPAFGYANGSVAALHKYDGILHHFLEMIQRENPELVAVDDDMQANYSFFRIFRNTAKAKARAVGLDSNVQTAMNRWRTIENAKGS